MKPLTTYTPIKDLNVGDFVLLKPHDLNLVPFLMGRVEGDVIKNEENEYFKMVRIQWWVLVKKGSNLDEQHLYEDCWSGKWKCNLVDSQQCLDISTILLSFPIQKNTTNKSQISILVVYVGKTKINFDVANASINLWRMLVTLIILYLQFFNVFCVIILIGLPF